MWVLLLLLAMAVQQRTTALEETYDEYEALRALELSEVSYCTQNRFECPACPAGVSVTQVVTEGKSGGLAVVGYDADDSSVFVSFRGTSNVRNWIENAKLVKTSPYDDYPRASVERGFYLWYEDLNASGVYDAVLETAKREKTKKLKVTGHSAGGACATLFAFDWARGIYPNLALEQHITFGSPRVGNEAFRELFTSFHLRKSFRVTHYHDVVPHMPFEKSMAFAHVPTEVYYDELNHFVKVCDSSGEDPSCSALCAPLHCTSVPDHLFYLNRTLGTDGCDDAFARHSPGWTTTTTTTTEEEESPLLSLQEGDVSLLSSLPQEE